MKKRIVLVSTIIVMDREDNLFPGMTKEEYHNSYLLLQTIDSDGGIDEKAVYQRRIVGPIWNKDS